MTPEDQLTAVLERHGGATVPKNTCLVNVSVESPYILEIELIIGNYPDHFIARHKENLIYTGDQVWIKFIKRCALVGSLNGDCADCNKRNNKFRPNTIGKDWRGWTVQTVLAI